MESPRECKDVQRFIDSAKTLLGSSRTLRDIYEISTALHAKEKACIYFDEDGNPNPAGRKAARFADELKNQTNLPVQLWDESFSTQEARTARIELGVSRKKRAGHQDAFAAVVILQSYLEAHRQINK